MVREWQLHQNEPVIFCGCYVLSVLCALMRGDRLGGCSSSNLVEMFRRFCHQISRRHIQDDNILHRHRRDSLTSHGTLRYRT